MLTLDHALQYSRTVFWQVVPERLFQPGNSFAAPVQVQVETLPLLPSAAIELDRIARTGRTVDFRLDDAFVLQKVIELPTGAASYAEEAISLHLRQTMPAQARGLKWRFKQTATQMGQTSYQVYLLRQAQLDSLLEDAAKLGAYVRSVRVASEDVPPFYVGGQYRASIRNKWLATAAAVVLFAGLAQVAILELTISKLEHTNFERADRLQQSENALVSAKEKAGKAGDQKEKIEQDVNTFIEQSAPLDKLIDLTDHLPDTVWISELDLSGSQISLSGFTSSAVTETIQQIQRLPWAVNARLAGPATVDSSFNQTRFDIVIPIETAAQKR